MAIEGSKTTGNRIRSAWSAAGRGHSSALCTASPRALTASSSWSPGRCHPTRKRRGLGQGSGPRSVALLWLVCRNGESRSRAAGWHRSGRHRDAEPCAFSAAKAFLEAGIHVICDKPVTSTMADAKKLAALVKKSGKLFVLTHNYTGYPMVRQAREMVQKGMLGKIRLVHAEYPQDWLTEASSKPARSRPHGGLIPSNPAQAGRPATSAPMPIISAASFPARTGFACRRSRTRSARAGRWMTMPISCCATRAGRRA